MDEGNWISLLALGVSGVALWRSFRTDAKIEAEKQPVLTATAPDPKLPGMIVLKLRSESNVGWTVERVRILWPPAGRIALKGSVGAKLPDGRHQMDWQKEIDPKLAVTKTGIRPDPLRMRSGEEHQSTLFFWLSSKMLWTLLSSRSWRAIKLLMRSDLSSHKMSVVLRVSLRSERDKYTTITKRATCRIPAISKPFGSDEAVK